MANGADGLGLLRLGLGMGMVGLERIADLGEDLVEIQVRMRG